MQTPPAAFSAFQNQSGAQISTLLKLTDGTSTWLLSDAVEAQLTDGHVYPLLQNYNIFQGFSIFTKQWTVSSIRMELSNLPYKQNTSGAWIRLSDELAGVLNHTATIYYLCGGNVGALSDCLAYYSGIVLESLEWDALTLSVTISNKSIPYDKELPATTIASIYSAAPVETKSLFVPLVYGDFTTDFSELKKSGLGLARCYAVSKLFNDFVVSNHILDAFTFAYLMVDDNDDIAQYISPTLNVNSSGRGRMTATGALAQAWIYPTDTDDAIYSMDGVNYADLTNAVDRDTATSLNILVNQAAGNGTTISPKAIYMMGLNDSFLKKINAQGQASYKFSTYFVKNASYSYNLLERRLYIYSDDNIGDVYNYETLPSAASYQETASWLKLPSQVGPTIKPIPDGFSALWYGSVEQPSFTGTGDSGMISGGTFAPTNSDGMKYFIRIVSTAGPNKFSWRKGEWGDDAGTQISITGSSQTLDEGVTVTFAATTGHTLNDSWTILVHADTDVVDAPVFIGSGLNDLSSGGTYSGTIFNVVSDFQVVIDANGTPDTFKWRWKSGQGTQFGVGIGGAYSSFTTGVSITGSPQTLINGVTVQFTSTVNHIIGDTWDFKAHAGKNDVTVYYLTTPYNGTKDAQYKVTIPTGKYASTERFDVYKDGVLIRQNTILGLSSPVDGIQMQISTLAAHDSTDYWIINAYAPREINSNFMLGLYIEGTIASGPRTLDVDNFGALTEARLKVKFNADGKAEHFAECRGREYGSWISSRSSAYASGAMISDPSGIIESILRDELGFVDADIDLTSFIAAENTSVSARMNLHSNNRVSAFEIIQQLAEQSTFAYLFTAAGKARLVELDNSTPTTNRIIPFSHIKGGKVDVSKTSDIINKITVMSRWQEEYDAYADNTETNNATSQTNFGIRRFEAEWPNIAGTSATHVVNHLVGNSTAIWANAHNQIDFETMALTNSDLELGDWIELDSVTVDPQFLCFGTTWSGKKFLVVELNQTLQSTKIKAIQLY